MLLGIEQSPAPPPASAEVFRRNPYSIGGRRLYYSSAIGTDPLFAGVILEQVLQFDAQRPKPHPSSPARLESQHHPSIGGLAGRRRKPDRRARDHRPIRIAPSPRRRCRRRRSPLTPRLQAARDIARYDAAGNYRPLKTAPNLRRGWRLTLATIEELHEALDAFYPAMLAARLAFQQGRLAVTPLRDTLNRQSGMYAITKKHHRFPGRRPHRLLLPHRRRLPGCLKTILWPIAPGDRQSLPSGNPFLFPRHRSVTPLQPASLQPSRLRLPFRCSAARRATSSSPAPARP